MQKSLCSICCLSYNHAGFIEYAVNSFFNQTYKNIEIIALDDGSNDNSVEILNNLKSKSPVPFTVLTQDNSGNIGANFNKLLKRANGEFVVFISLDDALINTFIKEQINIMERDSYIVMAGTTMPYVIDNNNNIQDNSFLLQHHSKVPDNPSPDFLLELEYEKAHSVFIQGCIFRKDIVLKIGGFDENILADDIVLRTKLYRYIIENREYKLHIQAKAGFYYRRHDTNISKNADRMIMLLAQYYYKYWFDRPAPKFIIQYFINYTISNTYYEILNKIKSHEFFIKLILENPKIAEICTVSNNNAINNLGYNYYTFSLPLFYIKKYRNLRTGKKTKEVCIFGIKFRI